MRARIRFRRFTEATIEGLVFHEQGKIVDANPAAIAMFGFSNVTGLIGRNLLDFIAPDSHKLVLQQMQLESVHPYEIQGIRKDGSTFPIETSTRAYKTGKRLIRASSLRDITERKQAEADKLREKNVSDATINSLPGIFYMFDTQGNLVRRNKNYETVAGYLAGETATRTALDAVAEEDRERVAQAIQRAFTEGKVEIEMLFKTRHGEKIPYLMTAVRMAIGDDMYVLGTGIDLSERKRLEQQIQTAFERRGRQVQLSTQVAQSIAAATSLEDLYQRVVTQVKEQFGYYHAQLLRYDVTQNAVVLITGYGETGAKMLSAGHRLPLGQGLIGAAAASGKTVLRPVLTNDPDWHPNPLLPETKGEIAVPIKLGDNILGVLDVQSSMANALDADDQLLLEGLCGQIATAIESTRLRQEMDERLEEINRLYQAVSYEGWQTYRETSGVPEGFMFDQSGLRPVKNVGLAEEFFSNLPLTVPGGEVIGTLAVADDPQHPISPEDQTFVQQVSEQVALALESARLFEQTQSALLESKEAEKAVRESEAKLSEALDIAKLANWEYDVERDRFSFNDHFYSIFHTTVEEMGGYELSSAEYAQRLVHPEDVPMVGAAIEKALASTDQHYSTKLEHRVIYGDGGIGYISVEVHIDRDDQGKIIRYYGANQDITERKETEAVLYANEELFRAAFENATAGVSLVLADGKFFRINNKLCTMLGYSSEELMQMTFNDVTYDEDKEIGLSALKQVLAGEISTASFEKRYIHKDGHLLHVFISFSGVRDQMGKFLYCVTYTQDITERKLAQEAIAKRAAELATVAEVSTTTAKTLEPDRLLQSVVDLSKEQFGLYHAHIYLADDAWSTLLLAAGAGEIGRQMVAEGHAIKMDTGKSLVARAARERNPIIVNDVHSEADFLSNPLLPDTHAEMAMPMIVGDKVLGVFDVQSDKLDGFTKEDANIYTTLAAQVAVALQNARLYAEQSATVTELRELDRLKTSFLANMSHELRTPLNSILGFSDVILEGLDGPVTEQMDNDLRLIGKNGQHLLHLINDVLDMSKIDAGRMNLQPEKFKLNDSLKKRSTSRHPWQAQNRSRLLLKRTLIGR